MLEYSVQARRIDAHGSRASCKDAVIVLDTDMTGRPDAFNPAELFLASIAACMIKGIERVTPMLKFSSAVSKSSFMAFVRIALPSCRRLPMTSSSTQMKTIGGSIFCTRMFASTERSPIR